MRAVFAVVLATAVGAAAFLLVSRGDSSGEDEVVRSGNSGVASSSRTSRTTGNVTGLAVERRTDALQTGASEALRRRAKAVLDRARIPNARSDHTATANLLLDEGRGAIAHPVVREAFLSVSGALVDRALPRGDDAVDDLVRARRLASAVYDHDGASDAELDKAAALVDRVHGRVLFGSNAPDELVLRHVVERGENLWTLTRKTWRAAGIDVGTGLVLHVNGLANAGAIPRGKVLRVPREPVTLLVRKGRRELTVRLGEAPLARFPVGIGADGSTPSGRFVIRTKIQEPDWYYGGRMLPYGDPENVIGSRWMGFEGDAKAQGIGIHGTNDESTVGQAMSMGCIRMRKDDVETLFEWVTRGTAVEVRD